MADINWKDLSVLIIDDEVFMQKLLQRVLNDMGVKNINKANNGAKGLELLGKLSSPPDVILCDLNMPEMNGLMFTSKLRGHSKPELKDIPVLVVTGHSDAKIVDAAVKIGINGYVVKPVSVDTLTKRLTHALTKQDAEPS